MPSDINLVNLMRNPVVDRAAQTALFIHTCIQQASFSGAQNNGVVHTSGMTDKYDMTV